MDRVFIAIGAIYGLLAVGSAAAAAHAPGWGSQGMRDAIQMLGWHALALIGAGLFAGRGGVLALASGGCFAVGTLLFVGAVFLGALADVHLGRVAPTGGMILMLGWALLAAAAVRAS